ncbi:glycosyltransferase family 2 protein [Parafrigoribacterium soli]|uniref:glycosyltransferase family 2 protein n=1 Tax=Parafrigoribacterium soli TaxID=3144663 RepID=UPI0032F05DFD
MPEPQLTLTIAVLSYRRPGTLRAGLPLVIAQAERLGAELARDVTAEVLVVDNDPAASARLTVDGIRSALDRPELLRYVVEPAPGIAAARNRALDESAASELLVFIDDDELPRGRWLTPLVSTWLDTRATAVMGRVISEFEGELDPWVAAGSFFRRRSMPTGTEITVAAAGNLLLDRQRLGELGVRFEPALGLGSGEDSLFSRQLVKRGGRMVWCEESEATDRVPRERMTRGWVLRRSWSHGNAETIVALHLAERSTGRLFVRIVAVARGLARVLAGGLRFLFGIASRSLRHQARGLRTSYRGAGILAGGLGIAYHEYSRRGLTSTSIVGSAS